MMLLSFVAFAVPVIIIPPTVSVGHPDGTVEVSEDLGNKFLSLLKSAFEDDGRKVGVVKNLAGVPDSQTMEEFFADLKKKNLQDSFVVAIRVSYQEKDSDETLPGGEKRNYREAVLSSDVYVWTGSGQMIKSGEHVESSKEIPASDELNLAAFNDLSRQVASQIVAMVPQELPEAENAESVPESQTRGPLVPQSAPLIGEEAPLVPIQENATMTSKNLTSGNETTSNETSLSVPSSPVQPQEVNSPVPPVEESAPSPPVEVVQPERTFLVPGIPVVPAAPTPPAQTSISEKPSYSSLKVMISPSVGGVSVFFKGKGTYFKVSVKDVSGKEAGSYQGSGYIIDVDSVLLERLKKNWIYTFVPLSSSGVVKAFVEGYDSSGKKVSEGESGLVSAPLEPFARVKINRLLFSGVDGSYRFEVDASDLRDVDIFLINGDSLKVESLSGENINVLKYGSTFFVTSLRPGVYLLTVKADSGILFIK